MLVSRKYQSFITTSLFLVIFLARMLPSIQQFMSPDKNQDPSELTEKSSASSDEKDNTGKEKKQPDDLAGFEYNTKIVVLSGSAYRILQSCNFPSQLLTIVVPPPKA